MRKAMLFPAVIGLAIVLLQAGCGSTREISWEDLQARADALYQKGQYSEAARLAEESLNIVKGKFGTEHPNVALSLNNLANLYSVQGKYAEAEPLYQRSLAIAEKAYGPDHTSVATSLNNLANLYQVQGNYAEAEPLCRRLLAIDEQALGPDHPDVATDLNNLAELYSTQDRYAEAEPLYLRSLAIAEKALGPNHPNVVTSLNNLAELYSLLGKYEEAESLYTRALEIWEKALGAGHPYVVNMFCALAEACQKQGKDAEAVNWYRKAAEQDHADAQVRLGVIYAEGIGVIKDYVAAHVWFHIAASNGHEKAADYRELLTKKMTASQMMKALELTSQWKSELPASERLAALERGIAQDPQNADLRVQIANLYGELGQSDRALEILEKVLRYQSGFPQAMFHKGIILAYWKNDVQGAIRIWEDLLRSDPAFSREEELEQKIKQLKSSFK